jgi:hypothetical protein
MVKMLCVKTPTRFSTSGIQSSHGQGKRKLNEEAKSGCMESLRENMVRV